MMGSCWTIRNVGLLTLAFVSLAISFAFVFKTPFIDQHYVKEVIHLYDAYRNQLENVEKQNSKEADCTASENQQPSWMSLKPEEMSAQELMDYLSWSNSSSCRLRHDFGGRMMKNPSGLDGQKAVCLQPISVAPPPNSCIIYSIGINNEWSFDDAMERYGCNIFAFDPSMKDAQDQFNRSSGIHFYKIGLGVRDETINSTGWKILSLESIRRLLGHQDLVIDYLKMDIEYHEWAVLPELMKSGELAKVRQMGIEFHLFPHESLEKHQQVAGILWSLEHEHGMNRFDSKANPWFSGRFSSMGIQGSFGYEIAWYNRKFIV